MAKIIIKKGSDADALLTFGGLLATALCWYLGFYFVTHVPKVYPDGSKEDSLVGLGVFIIILFAIPFTIASIYGISEYIKHAKKQ